MDLTQWSYEALGKKACEALKKNGFDARFVSTPAEAFSIIMGFVNKAGNAAFGGSLTLKELGIREAASEIGVSIIDHSRPGLSPEEKLDAMRRELTSDLFLTGANAVTLDGRIMNVDMIGNRLAAMLFGPKKVVAVAGANKIVRNEDEALTRIELAAGPMNSKRLGLNNPCAVTGVCSDCNSDTRICRAYQVLRKRPRETDFTVIIVGTAMGL